MFALKEIEKKKNKVDRRAGCDDVRPGEYNVAAGQKELFLGFIQRYRMLLIILECTWEVVKEIGKNSNYLLKRM